MKKVFLIDNYDSFTYNLVSYLEELNCKVLVRRNDNIDIKEIDGYDNIVISPGPGIPSESGDLKEVILKYSQSKNFLGVCLGQQAIAEVFGGEIENLDAVYHGVATEIEIIKDDYIFSNIPKMISVGRYHSWIVKHPLPDDLEATSFDKNGNIMSLRHKKYNIRGVQFHPESILTPNGKEILKNWVNNS